MSRIILLFVFSLFSTKLYCFGQDNHVFVSNNLATNPFYSNMLFPNYPSSYPNNNCISCNAYNYQSYPTNFFMQSPKPNNWLHNYGRYRYSNWNKPGVWDNAHYSLRANAYPNNNFPSRTRHAGGGLGKPYIYISGPIGKTIDINITFKGGTHWVSSPPAKDGWKVTIGANNKLIVDDIEYENLFYDYQIDYSHLQFSAGFCGKTDFILNEMISILKFSKFKINEINSFTNYWSNKIPNANYYCVYPQDDRQLKKGASITFNGQSSRYIRINFLIVLNPKKIPSNIWKPSYTLPKTSFELREWGVGFLLK